MSNFIGRTEELATLRRFFTKKTASLLVVRGRRRIGKSRLIEEFAKPYHFYSFSGTPPTEKTTAQSQRDEFASQLGKQGLPKIIAQDWNDLFWMLAEKAKEGRVVILFDEISWMGSADSDFLGKLKNAWDLHFKKNDQLILILCGSASSWIEKNILSSTGFVGRISLTLTLGELPLKDCQQFWGKKNAMLSPMEKFKILSVTGGVPRYLEEIDPTLEAEMNIKNLCFSQGALLVDEFDRLFQSVFLTKSDFYKAIVESLAMGPKEFIEICEVLHKEPSGRMLDYLAELELSGFIKKDHTWDLKTGQDKRMSRYRLSDNYLRFYLKYIYKYKQKIERHSFEFKSVSSLPAWDSILALQFENLVLNNRPYIWKMLEIKPDDIVSENPFFQKKTMRQAGCQIDYMIQTRGGSLYVCEIKFFKNPVSGSKIIEEVTQKIARLNRPKGLSCRPILIHANGVHENLVAADYFFKTIDFSEIFDTP